jgi:hypothetical protein
MKRNTFLGLAATALAMMASGAVLAAPTIYGNSASGAPNPIHILDGATGIESQRFAGNPGGNGRGIVVVGNIIYYTVTNDAHIYLMDRTTGLTTGSILTQNASMSTLAYDGTNFWTADYAGTNRAFLIDINTGLNIRTINLANAQNFMDGLEYFNGNLIGNRCDACGIYDIYDLNGNVLTAGFINTGKRSTGIAFDGTDFWVSNIFESTIGRYNGTTGALIQTISIVGGSGTCGGNPYFCIEDLSVDYSTRPDTGGGNVPEPGTLALFGLGLIGAAVKRRRKLAA